MNFGHKDLYINGQLVPATNDSVFKVISPTNEEVIATLSWAQKEDTEKTLLAAQKGFEYWSQVPVAERAEWMSKLRTKILEKSELLRDAISLEMGKSWDGSADDISSITDSLEFYAEAIKERKDIPIADKEGTHTHKIIQQPLGVVVAFLAYNFPLLNLGFKLGPALAAGCSIILKPSEFSPLSAYIIGEICEEIDFPKGVINIISGDVKEVGIPLCESTIPKLVTMIGSTETAQKLIAQSSKTSIKRYSMECGGNAPFIVMSDADLEKAVDVGIALKYGNTGQICVAPNRFYLHRDIANEFITRFVEKAQDVQIGFGKESDASSMGPLANEPSLKKVAAIVKDAKDQGGKLLLGGKTPDRKGYYYEPTVIILEDNKAAVLQEEIFGPVALMTSFTKIPEVIELANSVDVGLSSYAFSSNKETLKEIEEKLEFGEVHLNGFKYDIYLPHGGVKNSGMGVDCSIYALDDYLVKKRVTKEL